MYRLKYGISKERTFHLKSKDEKKKKRPRRSRSCPSYGPPRHKESAFDRDMAVLDWINAHHTTGDFNRMWTRSDPEPIEFEPKEIPVVEVSTKLNVKGVDLHIDENTKAHHTDMYACTEDRIRESDGSEQKAELVIRRGQDFKLTVHFDRPYNVEKNDITLSFNLGEKVNPSNKVKVRCKVDETGKNTKYKPKKWGATVADKKGNSLTLNVFVPASAPIGEWNFSVKTIVDVKDGKDIVWQYNHNEDINIIFNAWCKDDWVYMEDEKWRKEAVLNDMGAQYYGNYRALGARSWFFGQFEEGILHTAFRLVRKCFSFNESPGMGNAVTVARMISQIVNSCEDDGVLTGNWSGEYAGGTSPTKWAGSVKILEEFERTSKPVNFGQCWVFSGVVTTVCRALGLPCRSVTNYASAHNTDSDHLSIDAVSRLFMGEWVETSDDSVWNFHVWNEVWMARPDLSDTKEWDGWQVIDATPQEQSDGVFCCGPAPVKAVKEGELRVGKDTGFIFAEVNADKVHWTVNPISGKLRESRREKDIVGKKISTKQPTGRAYRERDEPGLSVDERLERLDLTSCYKYDEGSDKERQIVKKAEKMFQVMNGATIIGEFDEEEEEEEEVPPGLPLREMVTVVAEAPTDVKVGNPFEAKVHVTNTQTEKRAIKDVVVTVYYKTYFDGYDGVVEKRKFKDYYLDGGKTETFTVAVDDHVACAKPRDSFNFELKAVVSFFEVDDVLTDNVVFRLRRPHLKIKAPATCTLKDTVPIEVSLTNPLSMELTECELEVEAGFTCKQLKDHKLSIPNIGPKKTWTETLHMKPKKNPRGIPERAVSFGFDSYQLPDIPGCCVVTLVD